LLEGVWSATDDAIRISCSSCWRNSSGPGAWARRDSGTTARGGPILKEGILKKGIGVTTDWRVRRIDAGEGLRLRGLRLHALADAPTAFGSTLAREEAYAEAVWHQRASEAAAAIERVTFVAERAGDWLGMASGLADTPQQSVPMGPVLVGMFVDRSARRLGVGKALIESVGGWAASRGYEWLHLWVVSTNAPALGLYRQLGFAATGGARPLIHTPGLTEVQMVKRLASP
jgi:GNAT superfamily N-acetyltransferase